MSKKSNKLAEMASKLWPIAHTRFQEMCVLAATGQLGGPQMSELNDHIAECGPCRKFLESVAQASIQTVTALEVQRANETDVRPPVGMRERFLARMAEEKTTAGALKAVRPYPIRGHHIMRMPVSERSAKQERGADPEAVHRTGRSLCFRWAAGFATCAVIASSFYFVQERNKLAHVARSRQISAAPIASADSETESSDRVDQLEQQRKQLQTQLSELKSKLTTADAEQKALEEKLTDANNKLAVLISHEQSQHQVVQDDEAAKSQVTFLQGEVAKLRFALDDSKTKLVAEQNRSGNLQTKLDEANSDLLREQDMKDAKSQIGDLVAARNLHIVDVYDADSAGKRQRAFGRVFYTEGKSLVFYAYDLDDSRHLNANVVFHVWGEKAGVKETIHSLGLLHNDDASQARWALTFDDPKVLAQINSVYVTAESGKHSDEPRGRKVLYAYFGSEPNHP